MNFINISIPSVILDERIASDRVSARESIEKFAQNWIWFFSIIQFVNSTLLIYVFTMTFYGFGTCPVVEVIGRVDHSQSASAIGNAALFIVGYAISMISNIGVCDFDFNRISKFLPTAIYGGVVPDLSRDIVTDNLDHVTIGDFDTLSPDAVVYNESIITDDFDRNVTQDDLPNALTNPHTDLPFISTGCRVFGPRADSIMTEYSIGDRSIVYDDDISRKKFYVDHVFRGHTLNQEIYEYYELNCNFISGNAPVVFFFIGASGTGKSYTLSGEQSSICDDNGLVGRALSDLLSSDHHDGPCILSVTAMGINAKSVVDLCASKRAGISTNGFNIDELFTREIGNTRDVIRFVKFLRDNRTTAHTKLNPNSSRTRMITKARVLSSAGKIMKQILFIDLAGFEPLDLVECGTSSFINSSLLTLQNVLLSLVARSSQIPFRESMLTRILQPYLLSESKIIVLATIGLTHEYIRSDHNVLKFMTRITGKKRKKKSC